MYLKVIAIFFLSLFFLFSLSLSLSERIKEARVVTERKDEGKCDEGDTLDKGRENGMKKEKEKREGERQNSRERERESGRERVVSMNHPHNSYSSLDFDHHDSFHREEEIFKREREKKRNRKRKARNIQQRERERERE